VPLSRNLGTLTSWNPLGHSRPVTGLLYLCIRNVTEYTTCCFHIQGTRIKMTVFRDMTPYALVHTYQDSREKGYLILHCALSDQGYSWTWCRVINWWRGVSVWKENFASIFRIPPWVTRIWYVIVHPYRDIISLTVVFGPYLPAPFVNRRTLGAEAYYVQFDMFRMKQFLPDFKTIGTWKW